MRSLLLALILQVQFPAPVGYVNDFAGIIDDATKQAMLGVIDEVRQKSGGEIAVVTLSDLGGRASIDVARDIGRQWKVGAIGGPGDAAKNAGVVLLIKPGLRPGDGKAQIAIATGSGSEGFITDATAGRLRDAIGQAAVSTGRYDAGLLLGVQLLGQAYAREFRFELSGAAQPVPEVERPSGGSRFPLGLIPLLVFLVFFMILRRGGGQPRGILSSILWAMLLSGRGGRGGGGGGWGGGGGGGFGGFGGGGGFSGGGASGSF